MIPIDLGEEKKDIETLHRNALKKIVAQRIVKNCHRLCNVTDAHAVQYINILAGVGFSKCLTMSVDEMRQLVAAVDPLMPSRAFYRKLKHPSQHESAFKQVNEVLADIFDYDYFGSMSGEWNLGALALRLSERIRVCPYCNAETIYAYKVRVGKRQTKYDIKKSAFDHYFPKARYPFLAVSLYNLIPACTRCNSGFKSDKTADLLNMAHPYVKDESIDAGMKFRITFNKQRGLKACRSEDIEEIVFSKRRDEFSKGKVWENSFRISDTYTALYKEDVCDSLNMILQYPSSYIDDRLKVLERNGFPMSRGQVERMLYGSPIDRSKINITRMGKLINDIYETYHGSDRNTLDSEDLTPWERARPHDT